MNSILEYIPAGADAPVIDSGDAAAAFWRERVITAPQFRPEVEWAGSLFLDGDRCLLGHEVHSSGAPGWVFTSRRSILKGAILSGAAGIVAFHSHTGDDTEPSDHDMVSAKTLIWMLEALGLKLFDCVIIAQNGDWLSFVEKGLFDVRLEVLQRTREEKQGVAMGEVLGWVFEQDERIQECISEAAVVAGVPMEQWTANFLVARLIENFNPEPLEDRRLAFSAAVCARGAMATIGAMESARRAGLGLNLHIWQTGIELSAEHFESQAPPREPEPTRRTEFPAAELAREQ